MATLTYVPSRIGEGFFIDVPTPGSGDNAKALTYNHATGAFVYTAFDTAGTASAAVAAHVLAADPHTQYELETNNTASAILAKVLTVDGAGSGLDADLLDGNSSAAFLRASGADTGAVSSRQVFTNGITAPNWQPSSDSTTALQMRTASGTAFFTGDTTNQRIGIGCTPAVPLEIAKNGEAVRVQDGSGNYALRVDAEYRWLGINGGFSGASLNVYRYSVAGASDKIAHFADGTTLRTDILPSGVQRWYLNSGSSNVGSIQYSTPFGYPGIIFFTGSTYDANRFNVMNRGSAFSFGFHSELDDDGAGPLNILAGRIVDIGGRNATTDAITNSLQLRQNSTGTPAEGFGVGFAAKLESSTTEDRNAGRLAWQWVTATDASRASRGKLSAYAIVSSVETEQNAIIWDGDSGGVKLGFYGVTATARQVLATGAGATADDIIQALQNLGLVKQS